VYIDNTKKQWSCVQCKMEFKINGSWTAVCHRHFDERGQCPRAHSQGAYPKRLVTIEVPDVVAPALKKPRLDENVMDENVMDMLGQLRT
jgi:hypothetical protein